MLVACVMKTGTLDDIGINIRPVANVHDSPQLETQLPAMHRQSPLSQCCTCVHLAFSMHIYQQSDLV